VGVRAHRAQTIRLTTYYADRQFADLPEWDWYDIPAHLRCSQCDSVGCVDMRLGLGRSDQFSTRGFAESRASVDRHTPLLAVMPRESGIQYTEVLRFITDVSEYWIIRFRG